MSKLNTDAQLIDMLDKIKASVKAQSGEQYIPDIIEFCESKHYLNLPGNNIKLWPLQRIILKTFYRGQPGNEHISLDEAEIQKLFEFKLDNVLEKYHSEHLFRELVLVLGRRCISEDTLVFDAKTGISKKISDWHEEANPFSVWTLNEELSKYEIHNAKTVYQGRRACYRVALENGDYVDCTDNHPFFTQSGWKELKDLSVGDLVAQNHVVPKPDDGDGLQEHEASILGYMMGDGNCTESRSYFTCDDKNIINHFESCLNELSDNMMIKYDNNKTSPYQYSLRQTKILFKKMTRSDGHRIGVRDTSDLFRFLTKHELQGKTAKHKKVPPAIFAASSRCKSAFLNAYFSCDGYSGANNNSPPKIEAYSVNEALLEGVQCLLESLHIKSCIYKKISNIKIFDQNVKKEYVYNNHLSYRLQIQNQQSILAFCTYIGMKKKYSFDRVITFKTGETICFEPIKEIQTLGQRKTYDLSIMHEDEDTLLCRNFVINNGLVLHNSGKDFLVSLIALYEVMRLLEIPGGCPFKFYHMAEGNPIFILTVATSSDQARILFMEIKEKMTSSEYFRDKIGHMEADKISLLTPQDRKKSKRIIEEGLDNAASKIKGSVVIMSGHSNSESLLGKRIYALLLDEVASFKTTGGATSGDRIYSALTPATADFIRRTGVIDPKTNKEITVTDSKIISISSPRSEEGKLFELYNKTPEANGRLAFKLPTWKVSVNIEQDKLRSEFKFMSENEFGMEFGAEFSGTAGEKFIPDHYVDEAMEIGAELGLTQRNAGIPGMMYYAHLDPALSSHNYALIVLHIEERVRLTERDGQIIKEKTKMFIIDHMKFWQPEGNKSINVYEVDRYIADLARRFRFAKVSYDSWNSEASVRMLRRKGVPTIITQFNRAYKMRIYDHLEQLFVNHQIALPRKGPCAQVMEMELKCLKRIFVPSGFKIEANPEAQITTDDLCVSPDTTVFRDNGPCEIKDLNVGDLILTHQGRFRKVIAKSEHNTKEECYEIKPYYGFPLQATGNHPIQSFQENDNGGIAKFTRLDKLRCSDEVVKSFDTTETPFEIDLINYIPEPKSKNHRVNFEKMDHGIEKIRSRNPNAKWINRKVISDSSFGYFCGLYVVEGHFSDHGTSFSTNIKEKHIHNELKKCCNSVFGISPTSPVMMEGNGCQMALNSTLIKEFMLDLWGHHKAPEKRLPLSIMIAPKIFQGFVLRGMFDGDGSCSDRVITFTSTSKKLCHQIQHLLLRQHIVSSISVSKRQGNVGEINGRKINCNSDLYNVRIIDASSYNSLANILRIDHHKTQSKYHKPRYRFVGDSLYAQIRSIKRCELDTVINITVDEDNSFVAESVNTHNCDALAGATGLAMDNMYSGYPQSGLVQMPQIPSQGAHAQWNIGRGHFGNQQWTHFHRKFGLPDGGG